MEYFEKELEEYLKGIEMESVEKGFKEHLKVVEKEAKSKSESVSVKLPTDLISDLEKLAKHYKMPRTEVIRKILIPVTKGMIASLPPKGLSRFKKKRITRLKE